MVLGIGCLFLVRAPDFDTAAPRATGITLQRGFHFLTIEQSSQMDMSAADAPQDYLKAVILKEEEKGQAIIVYDEELPPDS